MNYGLWFMVYGVWLIAYCLLFIVYCLWFRVKNLGCRVQSRVLRVNELPALAAKSYMQESPGSVNRTGYHVSRGGDLFGQVYYQEWLKVGWAGGVGHTLLLLYSRSRS